MPGEKPKFEVFLSYRVAADANMAMRLYEDLSKENIVVYLDCKCLKDGEPWEQGFCEGLVNSSIFVPLLSKAAINNPEKDWQNFAKLQKDSRCDNVLLEHRLALELVDIGLIDKILPILIGNGVATDGVIKMDADGFPEESEQFFASGGLPSCKDVCVESVEVKTCEHMEKQGLGTPMVKDRTVKSVVEGIMGYQGAFIHQKFGPAIRDAVVKIKALVNELRCQENSTEV